MNSLIFSALARPLCALMLGVSLFILWRGHNEPGGGFIGGLVAASGLALLALADGIRAARRALRVHPMVLLGLGLGCGLLSGLPGLVSHASFLTHGWFQAGGVHVGTTLLFDIGVYLTVLGGVTGFVLRFYEEEDEA